MKTLATLLLSVALVVSGLAATSPSKSTGKPTAPASKPAATKAAVDLSAKAAAAARPAVTSYIQSKSFLPGTGDARTRVISVSVESTEKVSGWADRYRSSGKVTFTIPNMGKQTRNFSVTTEVKGGAATVVDVSTS